MVKLVNDCGYTEDRIRDNWFGTNGETGAHIDQDGVVRWNINNQIPFEDMLADFRALDLIDEENQLHSNLLREKETDEFWQNYFNDREKEVIND
jgi:hypothetical protein